MMAGLQSSLLLSQMLGLAGRMVFLPPRLVLVGTDITPICEPNNSRWAIGISVSDAATDFNVEGQDSGNFGWNLEANKLNWHNFNTHGVLVNLGWIATAPSPGTPVKVLEIVLV